jgi:THUMP domain-like/RNA cap guanine-N2 methyltransferase
MTTQSALLSQPGRELLERLAGENVSPERALQLAESPRGSYPPDLVAAALTQQALRISARAKFSRADEMLFTRAGLEQASSELAARHCAARFADARAMVDLCCGIGGDLVALAVGRQVIAVDRDLTSMEFARHNAAVYGAADQVAAVCADVRHLVSAGASRAPASADASQAPVGTDAGRFLAGADAVFIDPARRGGGHRLRAGSSEPPLDWCLSLTDQVPAVGIKAAPGLAHELAPAGWEIEFVAIGRGLKEALLWSPELATTRRRATVLPSGLPRSAGHTLVSAPGPPVPVAPPGAFLLDPNPAVTRAGLVEELARELGAWKIDPMIAFLTADGPLHTPFARTLRLLESAPWNEKQFARRLRALHIGSADIRRRGLAGDVQQIHRRLGLQGDGSALIVLTRVNDKPWGLICAPVDDPGQSSARS